jgi:hypothetical protein
VAEDEDNGGCGVLRSERTASYSNKKGYVRRIHKKQRQGNDNHERGGQGAARAKSPTPQSTRKQTMSPLQHLAPRRRKGHKSVGKGQRWVKVRLVSLSLGFYFHP